MEWAPASAFKKSSKPRNLTRISFIDPISPVPPSHQQDTPLSPYSEGFIKEEEDAEGIWENPTDLTDETPQYQTPGFKRLHDPNASYGAAGDRASGGFFDLVPTESETSSAPGSRPETPIDINKEDPKEGLMFLKPPVTPKLHRSAAESLKRKTRAMSAAYIEYINSFQHRKAPSQFPVPESKHQKVNRKGGGWWRNCSTRTIILLSTGSIIAIFLTVGIALGLMERNRANNVPLTAQWRPAIGTTWQIQLNEPVSDPSYRAYVYDVDFFDNNSTTVDELHALGRRVLCHFSAGTYETWQITDTARYPIEVLGKSLIGWGIERWIDIRNSDVKKIMADRISSARAMGCDGIVPDNVNGYLSDTGFDLTTSDCLDYVRYLSKLAHKEKLSIGLINAPELISDTLNVIDFGMNEGCAETNTCQLYQPFIQAGKAVFHIEYESGTNEQSVAKACGADGVGAFSTLIKKVQLDDWFLECPVNNN